MSLNLVLALVVLGYNNKSLKSFDFRDAMSDRPASGQLMNNSLASLTPAPVTPADAALVPVAPVIAAPAPADLALAPVQAAPLVSEAAPVVAEAPVKTAAPIKTAALMIRGGNDWAAYRQDAAGDGDVFVSNIFLLRKNGEKAVVAAVRKNKARGREILFSCVLPAKSGGVFYVIRMAPPAIHPPQVAAAYRRKSAPVYSTDLSDITSDAESEIQMMY